MGPHVPATASATFEMRRGAAVDRLIHFENATVIAHRRFKATNPHGFADTTRHEPSGVVLHP
jgi:hypothetical protein